jgi:hypothetical protein
LLLLLQRGFTPVKLYLIEGELLRYLTREELQSIVSKEDLEEIREVYFSGPINTLILNILRYNSFA